MGDRMQQTYQITVESEPKPAEMGVVVKGLMDYNASQADGDTPNYLFITVRGDDGEVEGGVVGASYLGWMTIQAVWMTDKSRGQGHGTKLMQAAEEEAIRRGCPRVFLETL